MNLFDLELVHFLYQLILGFGLVFIVLGLFLLCFPGTCLRFITFLNIWVDTSGWFSFLNKRIKTEQVFYHHHRLFGLFIFLASLWILYVFLYQYSVNDTSLRNLIGLDSVLSDWLVASCIFLLRFFSLIFIILGGLIFFRPSALKYLEQKLNFWVNTDPDATLEIPHQEAEEFLARQPRLMGAFIAAAGLYLTLSAAVLLLG